MSMFFFFCFVRCGLVMCVLCRQNASCLTKNTAQSKKNSMDEEDFEVVDAPCPSPPPQGSAFPPAVGPDEAVGLRLHVREVAVCRNFFVFLRGDDDGEKKNKTCRVRPLSSLLHPPLAMVDGQTRVSALL
jgi:hypothetical protein